MDMNNQMTFDDVKFHHDMDDMESLCRSVIDMIQGINNYEFLESIYYFVKVMYDMSRK